MTEDNKEWPRGVWPYVHVRLIYEKNDTLYAVSNPYTKLRAGDLVTVHTVGTYKIARVVHCYDEDTKPAGFRASYDMVEHRIDTERMTMEDQRRRKRKEIEQEIQRRFRELTSKLTLDDFKMDPELSHLRAELNEFDP